MAELLLVALTVFLLFVDLGRAELAPGQEASAAAMARQMFQRASPWFPFEPAPGGFSEPLLYQLLRFSQLIFVSTGIAGAEFAARLPSVLFGLLQIACVRGIARRAGGISGRRFAHLALLFTPGWLTMTRQAGAAPVAVALLLTGLGMTIHRTTHLIPEDPEPLSHGDDPRLALPEPAPPMLWAGAGVLWGLAALAAGPACLLVLLPACLSLGLMVFHGSRDRPAMLALRPVVAAASMAGVYSLWPISRALRASGERPVSLFDPGAGGSGMASPLFELVRAYPVLSILALLGAILLAFRYRLRRVPEVLFWALGLLALLGFRPDVAAWAAYGLFPAAAVFVGVGLLATVHWFLAANRPFFALVFWIVIVAVFGAEFALRYEGIPKPEDAIRSFSTQLRPYRDPGEPIGVLDLPSDVAYFYFNEAADKPHAVRRFVVSDLAEPPPAAGVASEAPRFLFARTATLAEAGDGYLVRWRELGRSSSVVLLERLPAPSPGAPR